MEGVETITRVGVVMLVEQQHMGQPRNLLRLSFLHRARQYISTTGKNKIEMLQFHVFFKVGGWALCAQNSNIKQKLIILLILLQIG